VLLLTGTMPGKTPTKPGTPLVGDVVSVTADLLTEGDQIKIVATGIYHGTAPTRRPRWFPMPTGRWCSTSSLAPSTRMNCPSAAPDQGVRAGGQIVIEGKSDNVTIDLDRLRRP